MNDYVFLQMNHPAADKLLRAEFLGAGQVLRCQILPQNDPAYLVVRASVKSNPELDATLHIPHQAIALILQDYQARPLGFSPPGKTDT